MFSSSFTMSEQKHRHWTPYKQAAPGSLCEHDTDLLLSKTVSPSWRNCMVRVRPLEAELCSASVPFPPSPLSVVEEGEGERKVRVCSEQGALLQGAGAGGKPMRSMMLNVVCPACEGAKALHGIACSSDGGCRSGEITCDFCKGEGQVSAEAGERWHRGRARREARFTAGRSLFEEAGILGIEPDVLNEIEHGRRTFDEQNNPSI